MEPWTHHTCSPSPGSLGRPGWSSAPCGRRWPSSAEWPTSSPQRSAGPEDSRWVSQGFRISPSTCTHTKTGLARTWKHFFSSVFWKKQTKFFSNYYLSCFCIYNEISYFVSEFHVFSLVLVRLWFLTQDIKTTHEYTWNRVVTIKV